MRISSTLLCIALFFSFGLIQAQVPDYVPKNGLIGWWPLNGNATDESGNGNDGVVYGAKSQKNRFDQPTSSLELNGKSDYIVMKKNGPLGSDSRTVSVWVKTNDVSTSIIVSWGYGSEGSDFNLWSNYSCNGITLDINHSAKTYNSKFTNGDWNHYVVVYDKSIGSKLSAVVVYENGKVLDSKCAETGYGVINTGLGFPITLGKYHARNSEYLEGIIDDLAVWNRALTPMEVSELYHSSNNPDKNIVNTITLDDKSDLIKSDNEHKGVNKGTTNDYDTDLDTTNAKPINDKSKKNKNTDPSVSATKIGKQYWMTQNLNVTKFRNGKIIPFAKNIKIWSDYHNAKQPAYCYERFDEKYKGKGYYYNTWAICDSNLAPTGWRVPSKDDFLQLGKSLGRDAHLKLKSKDQWYVNRVYGNFNGNNKSGFNAYPNYLLAGYFDYTGYEDLDYISKNGYFEGSYNEARFGITCSDEYFQLGSGYTAFPWGFGKITSDTYNPGLMIRCVK